MKRVFVQTGSWLKNFRMALFLLATAALCPAAPVVNSVLNGASFTGTLAPGTWAAIFGTSFAASTTTASSVPLPTVLGGVTVTFGGIAAPLYFVSSGQINAVIPFAVPIPVSATATVPVVVTSPSGTSTAFAILLVKDAPAIFTQNGSGGGAPLAFDANFRPVTSTGNGTIVLYAAGLGATNPPGSSSSGGASVPPLNTVQDGLSVFVGDTKATIGFGGLAPGFPGIYQLNVTPNGPMSDRIYLQSGPAQSNITTLPTTAGGNVANVIASIDGIFPATGSYIAKLGGPGGPVQFSLTFMGAAFDAGFDILPGAKPFSVVATSDGGNAVINIDPAHGTWQASMTVPTAAARNFDYSSVSFPVDDFVACALTCYIPGNIVPASREDLVMADALQLLAVPNTSSVSPSIPVNGAWAASGTLTGAHFSVSAAIGSGNPAFFGGFFQISHYGTTPRTAAFNVYVDGALVASTTTTYTVR